MYDTGIKGPLKAYQIETLHVSDGDVIILHLSDGLTMDDINYIYKDVQQYFPNNKVICANEHILKKISVIKKDTNPFINIDLEDLL